VGFYNTSASPFLGDAAIDPTITSPLHELSADYDITIIVSDEEHSHEAPHYAVLNNITIKGA
jgi:hypothetical protein